ncbi:SAM-dependent methyltransferase [Planomicrobium okeanokoites]|uniref:SAM-dependent methyltransferase n=1 Tax=Planomicrobium okeanokoites TaxID=244 RepID=UPI00248FDDC1|nr:class I SAM-dependent methyltransferase [Planomicrobium okeanokoites]
MNAWDKRFGDEEYVYGTEPNVFLESIQPTLPRHGNSLSIAEGEGRNAVFLAEQGLTVEAWDYAQNGLDKVDKLARDRGVQIQTRLVDLADATWEPDKWDEVVCIFGHFPSETRKKTLQGIRKSVKPGGYFVSEVYSEYQIPYQSGGPKELDFLYTPEEFLTEFKGWRMVHFFMGEVTRNEGNLHKGLSHVIQCVFQKK